MINIHSNTYFEFFNFPGGEIGIKWVDNVQLTDPITLLARINCSDDLIKLLTITDAIRRLGIQKINVVIPYFPAARQDRVANPREAFSLKIYTDIINSQNYNKVKVVDPHSDVTTALLNNLEIIPVKDILYSIILNGEYDTILIPDAGATKKMFSYYFPTEFYRSKVNFVQCLKKRDTVTGKLSGFQICESIKNHARCLVVDDIIDGGGTFIGLADALRYGSYGWAIDKLSLYATHGIFSQGVQPLLSQEVVGSHGVGVKQYFDQLYTTNSIKNSYPKEVRRHNVCE